MDGSTPPHATRWGARSPTGLLAASGTAWAPCAARARARPRPASAPGAAACHGETLRGPTHGRARARARSESAAVLCDHPREAGALARARAARGERAIKRHSSIFFL